MGGEGAIRMAHLHWGSGHRSAHACVAHEQYLQALLRVEFQLNNRRTSHEYSRKNLMQVVDCVQNQQVWWLSVDALDQFFLLGVVPSHGVRRCGKYCSSGF